MRAVLLPILFVLLLPLAAATTVGEFTCPPGQQEDIACAAACCSQAGGTYDYGDESCTVDTQSQWNAAMQCEQRQDCCESSSSSGGGCCCAAFILLAGGAGLVGLAAWKKQ